MRSSIGLIIQREYIERVSKKSFIISTLIVPIVMVGIMFLPVLLMELSSDEKTTYAVIDRTEIIGGHLEGDDEIEFSLIGDTLDAAKGNSGYAGIIVIGKDALSRPSDISMYTHDAGKMNHEEYIRRQLKNAIETERLKAYNIENLNRIMSEVNADVSLNTYRLDKSGEEQAGMDTTVSFLIGLGIAFTLYMFLLIYGQLVMTSIIEEKNNRVLEIVVSSIRPEQLMLGKILGIGLVAFTQILLWGVILFLCVTCLMPAILPAELTADIAAAGAGSLTEAVSGTDTDTINALAIISDFSYLGEIFFWLVMFLIGGFLLYSSIFAAIGSAVDNIQDASQLQIVATVPIIIAIACATFVASDPDSTLSVWLSMIPFTSPMLMMIRIPFGVPVWQTILSYVLLAGGFIFMVWFAAKIYRVGIFMYGKKPTLRELIKWARYK